MKVLLHTEVRLNFAFCQLCLRLVHGMTIVLLTPRCTPFVFFVPDRVIHTTNCWVRNVSQGRGGGRQTAAGGIGRQGGDHIPDDELQIPNYQESGFPLITETRKCISARNFISRKYEKT